jgi:hypothetical protein
VAALGVGVAVAAAVGGHAGHGVAAADTVVAVDAALLRGDAVRGGGGPAAVEDAVLLGHGLGHGGRLGLATTEDAAVAAGGSWDGLRLRLDAAGGSEERHVGGCR